MRAAVVTLACIGALLAMVPAAHATQRYAAPSGGGPKAECQQANPCSLKDAMEGAKANDEVIITSGAYTLASPATLSGEATGADVHGDPSGPPPTITASVSGHALGVFAPKARLSYVDVTNAAETSSAIACGTEVSVERVRAASTGKRGYAIQQARNCAIRDSLIRAEGDEGLGLATTCDAPVIGRNLTIVAPGSKSVGARASYGGAVVGGSCTLDLKNSIVSGSLYDLQTIFVEGLGPGNIVVDYSNFDVVEQGLGTAIEQGSGNQTAAPHFVDAANRNYREAAGSPTIDAGIASQLGSLDLDGNARVIGPAPDIGAYEFVPPPVPPPVPGQIQSLTIAPTAFKPVNVGGAVLSKKRKSKAPVSTTITYRLSGAAVVVFSVERRLPGRRVGKRCVKQTRTNRSKKKCSRFKRVKGSFANSGQAGQNRLKFSGRIAGKSLKPGRYRLVGRTGSASKTASFKIVK
jgi:hypothetical protein